MKKIALIGLLLVSFMSFAEEADEIEDKALTQATESMVTAPAEQSDSVRAPASSDDDKTEVNTKEEGDDSSRKKEDQIPAFREAHAKSEKSQSLWGRLILSLVVVVAVAGGLVFATRRMTKAKNAVGSQAKVKINHQLHLGPKKSVALIEVAGEHLLVGITDHNINLLKTLSIINDEIPEQVPYNFEETLQEDFHFGSNSDVRIR